MSSDPIVKEPAPENSTTATTADETTYGKTRPQLEHNQTSNNKFSETQAHHTPKKSLFSIKKEQSEAMAKTQSEPENLPNETFQLEHVIRLWDAVANSVSSLGNTMQTGLMSQWKPIAVQESKVILQVPSQTVEKIIREILEPHLPEIKKSLNNHFVEFSFEIIEVKDDNEDERKIPQHIRDFQYLISKYPEVDKLRELFGLHPTEM